MFELVCQSDNETFIKLYQRPYLHLICSYKSIISARQYKDQVNKKYIDPLVIVTVWMDVEFLQCQKLAKIFTGPIYKLLLSFMVISDVCRSFISNKAAFTK